MTTISIIFPDDDSRAIDIGKVLRNQKFQNHLQAELAKGNMIEITIRETVPQSSTLFDLPIEFDKNKLIKQIIDENNLILYFQSLDQFTEPERKYIMSYITL